MLTIERTIDAPPSLVFALYTDPGRLPAWQPGVRGVLEQSGPLDEVGATYVLDQPGPRLRIEVLRVDRPTLHEQLESFRFYGWLGTARFDPLPDGRTRFRYRYSARGRFGWLWLPLIAVSALSFGRAEFSRLKEAAERTALEARSGREQE